MQTKKKNCSIQQLSPAVVVVALRGMPQSGLLTPPLFKKLSNTLHPVNYRGKEISLDHKIRGENIRPTETWPVATRRKMSLP